ncbi:O-antigen ligase family protein [Azospirillum sp. sgz301742]
MLDVDQVLAGDVLGIVAALAAFCGIVTAMLRWMPLVVAIVIVGVIEGHLGIDLGIRVADRTVSPADLIFIIAMIAGSVRLLLRGGFTRIQFVWMATVLVLLVAFGIGALQYGFDTATTFYRRYFYLSAGTLYALSFTWTSNDLDRLARIWLAAAGALVCYTLLAWIDPDIATLAGPTVFSNYAEYEAERVLPSSSAFLIAEAGLLCLAAWSRLDVLPLYRAAAIPFLLIAILLYHRSVWFVMLVAIAVLPLLNPRAVLRIGLALLIVPLGLAVVWLVGLGFGQDVLSASMSSAIMEPLNDDSTLSWRLTGWRILVDRTLAGGLPSILFGSGFGIGYERLIGWSTIQYSPHNLYVELFINAGIAGSGLWILWLLMVLRRLWSGGDDGGQLLDRAASMALFVAVAAFGLPYTPAMEQGILVGAIAALAMRLESRRTMPVPAPREAAA